MQQIPEFEGLYELLLCHITLHSKNKFSLWLYAYGLIKVALWEKFRRVSLRTDRTMAIRHPVTKSL